MQQTLEPNEIEFFIETNGSISAERALLVGESFLSFVRAEDLVGATAQVEIVHLGRGSFCARLLVVLRDPATAGAAALLAVAMSGYQLLAHDDGSSPFVEQAALACIEAGASRCGIRVIETGASTQTEFSVERSEMPAAKMLAAKIEASGAPTWPPPSGYTYLTDAKGRYLKDDGEFLLEKSVSTAGSLPTSNVLFGIVERQGGEGAPWILETDDGFRVAIKLEEASEDQPILRHGERYEFQGRIELDQQGPTGVLFHVATFKEAPQEESRDDVDVPESNQPYHYTNIPLGSPAWVTGQLEARGGEQYLVQLDGAFGRVDEIVGTSKPPEDTVLDFLVSATRGDHGGFADRGVKVHKWRTSPNVDANESTKAARLKASPEHFDKGSTAVDDFPEDLNARRVSLVGQLDDSGAHYPFEFVDRSGARYFAWEASDFDDIIALKQDVFIDATLAETDDGPMLYIHRLRLLD